LEVRVHLTTVTISKFIQKRLFDNNLHLYLLEIKKSIIVALVKL
jgi:hypothetical protein